MPGHLDYDVPETKATMRDRTVAATLAVVAFFHQSALVRAQDVPSATPAAARQAPAGPPPPLDGRPSDPARPEGSGSAALAVLFGAGLPFNGLTYGLGAGAQLQTSLGHVAIAGALFIYSGDEKNITYGPVPGFSIKGGRQQYNSLPIFLVGDGGYAFSINAGALRSAIKPFVSTGVMALHIATSGVYGDADQTQFKFCLGWGVAYRVRLGDRLAVGLQYRMYPNLGDDHIDFGSPSKNEIPHGFSTSIFYHAITTEIAYRIGGP